MKSIDFTFTTSDDINVYCKKWVDADNSEPKGVVQIAHGMAEHIARYELFAKSLVNAGYIVYGNDHRGHGKTGKETNSIGYFAEDNGFDRVVEDMYELTTLIKNEHPTLPIFLLGHSMGSFLTRRYIQLYGSQIEGVLLSGTGGNPGFIGKMGIAIAKQEMKRKGGQTQSPLMNKLTFGSYNKSFKPARTEFDWLTRDEQEVDKYIEDPLCGGIFTSGFYYDLLTGIAVIYNDEENKKIPLDLPIFLLSGDKDPVGNFSKGVLQASEVYKKLGMRNVTVRLYKEGRHEILNEINKEEVYQDIIDWLNTHEKKHSL